MSFPELHPKIVLGVAAHPDDLDFGAAGTMAKFAAEGAEVYYLLLTDGSKGSEDRTMTPEKLTAIRQEEQRNAVKAIGGKDVKFLAYPDGCLEVTMELKQDIVRHIRTIKPDVVITIDPSILYDDSRGFINHPDHRAAGQATLDAVFPLARDHMSFPGLFAQGFEPHKTPTILLIRIGDMGNNFTVDVTETMDKKIAALQAHVSQVPNTPEMYGWIKEVASTTGANEGYTYAEGFNRIDIN